MVVVVVVVVVVVGVVGGGGGGGGGWSCTVLSFHDVLVGVFKMVNSQTLNNLCFLLT